MTEPTDREVGANLAELYRKGTQVLPAVAAEFGTASGAIKGSDTWTPFTRSGGEVYQNNPAFPQGYGFGGGPTNGPGDSFAAAIGALCGHIAAMHDTLADCSTNIVKTAQDFARTDAEVRAAFIAEGGKL